MKPRPRLLCALVAGWCLAASGCAVYTPYKVCRWTFDYNTERALAFQAAGYDHLPPRVIRSRLTQWAYNVGPSPVPATMMIPDGTPLAPPSPDGPALPPASSPDRLDPDRPPEPSSSLPAPPTPQNGPSAGRWQGTSISYEKTAQPQAASAWLFAPR